MSAVGSSLLQLLPCSAYGLAGMEIVDPVFICFKAYLLQCDFYVQNKDSMLAVTGSDSLSYNELINLNLQSLEMRKTSDQGIQTK